MEISELLKNAGDYLALGGLIEAGVEVLRRTPKKEGDLVTVSICGKSTGLQADRNGYFKTATVKKAVRKLGL